MKTGRCEISPQKLMTSAIEQPTISRPPSNSPQRMLRSSMKAAKTSAKVRRGFGGGSGRRGARGSAAMGVEGRKEIPAQAPRRRSPRRAHAWVDRFRQLPSREPATAGEEERPAPPMELPAGAADQMLGGERGGSPGNLPSGFNCRQDALAHFRIEQPQCDESIELQLDVVGRISGGARSGRIARIVCTRKPNISAISARADVRWPSRSPAVPATPEKSGSYPSIIRCASRCDHSPSRSA